MRLFKQTPEDYYNAPYAEFPALIRGTVVVVMAILWAFSKRMWRWKVEDAVHVDSTAHTIDEVVSIIEDLINQRR